MNIKSMLWILSSLMVIILSGIGFLLTIDFDPALRRIAEDNTALNPGTDRGSVVDIVRGTSESTSEALYKPPNPEWVHPEKLEMEISPALRIENSDKKIEEIIGESKRKPKGAAPRLARLEPGESEKPE